MILDNARAMVLAHTRGAITWHPSYADFAGYFGFRPWACALSPAHEIQSGVGREVGRGMRSPSRSASKRAD